MSQAVAVAEPVKGGKAGKLFGGALTDEALDSSRSVLGTTHFGQTRGLQQFYTPPEAAEFIKQVLDPLGRLPVLDPTAGNGALLAPWPSDQRFGVEIDGDQVNVGDYHSITGDLQRVFPMLRKLGVQFPQIVANPPFGLNWTDGAGRSENSTVAVWRMSLALLAPDGVGAFICGRDRFRREVLTREDATSIPVADVARRVGYRQAGHFARAFRRRLGLSPSAYRAQAHQARRQQAREAIAS